MKKNILKTICVMMVVAMVGVMMAGCGKKDEYYIVVELTPEASSYAFQQGGGYPWDGGIDYYTLESFPEISISEFSSVFTAPDRLLLFIALQNSSKKNNLNAIKLLEKRDDVFEIRMEKNGGPVTAN